MVKQKAIVMLSGGLDSRLAVKLMQEKGMGVVALFFKLPFSKDCEKEVKKFCKENKVKLKVFDCTKGKLLLEYLDIVRKPKYGRGVCMNPCIDCRIFILKKAKKFADTKNFSLKNFGATKSKTAPTRRKQQDFVGIATGEVLNERPMSQNAKAMKIVENESGLKERLVRPLCEIGIQGRSRKKQIALAKKFKISYPQPAGGCLLCEKELKDRIKDLLKKKNVDEQDVRLINIGRHFENSNIILGKNKKENEILEKMKGIKVIPKQPGATALILPHPSSQRKKIINKTKTLIQKYSKHKIRGFGVRG